MRLRFYIDPQTGAPHIHNHSVGEFEVYEVLASPHEVRGGRDGSIVALGQTRAGRYLRVVWVPDDGGLSAFVVTAFEPGPRVVSALRRRLRKKR